MLELVEKRRLNGRQPHDVRSFPNGYVYCRKNVVQHQPVVDAAIRAIEACGLDFGAVDMAYDAKTNRAAVIEVNTAVGITGEGPSADLYARSLIDMINGI